MPPTSGRYPIFKPGVDSLGGQALQVEIRRVVLEATEKAERGEVEILVRKTFFKPGFVHPFSQRASHLVMR